MKRITLLLLCLLTGLGTARAQTVAGTVTLTFDLGLLTDAQGGLLSDGSLVQILANYDGTTLAAPTAGDFLGGDTSAAVLWQGAFDSSTTGIDGAMTVFLSNLTLYADGTTGNYLTAGATLFVRWYPALTAADSAPGVTTFGQYGYSMLSGATLDATWVVPSAGSAVSYALLTLSVGGSLDESAGQAVYTTSAIPEPSTAAALCGLAGLGLALRLRRKAPQPARA